MTKRISRYPRATPVALALAAVLGLAAGFAMPGNAGSPDLSCKVVLSDMNGLVEVAAYVEAEQATYGSYRMDIRQNGNEIRQEGDFEALPGGRTELSQAVLSGHAVSIWVDLLVTANGKKLACPVEDREA